VTSNNPDGKALRRTTLLPLYFPASKIKTRPGVRVLDAAGALGTTLFLLKCVFSSSAGYQVLDLLEILALAGPP